jgi:hypothetical protein
MNMKHSEQQAAISDALSKAQAVMGGAKKDAANPFFKSKYADLASCWEACKGALTANGIAVVQGCSPHDHGVLMQTRLTHKSGEWIEDDGLFVPATKSDAQGFGSALTYARRYGLCAMVGIAPEDDDGNAAAKKPATSVAQQEMEALPPDERTLLAELAGQVRKKWGEAGVESALGILESFGLDTERRLAIWSLFDSKERAALKKAALANPESKL